MEAAGAVAVAAMASVVAVGTVVAATVATAARDKATGVLLLVGWST